jgi:hypothetical protein
MPLLSTLSRGEKDWGVGLIVAVFPPGTFKLSANDIVCLLLGFVIRGDFPAWEDLIRYAPEDLREWIARNKQTFSK